MLFVKDLSSSSFIDDENEHRTRYYQQPWLLDAIDRYLQQPQNTKPRTKPFYMQPQVQMMRLNGDGGVEMNDTIQQQHQQPIPLQSRLLQQPQSNDHLSSSISPSPSPSPSPFPNDEDDETQGRRSKRQRTSSSRIKEE